MIERLAIDTNATIEWLAPQIPDPPPLASAGAIVLPLPTVGELYTGVFGAAQRLEVVETLLRQHQLIASDLETARIYGQLRASLRLTDIRAAKMNDRSTAW